MAKSEFFHFIQCIQFLFMTPSKFFPHQILGTTDSEISIQLIANNFIWREKKQTNSKIAAGKCKISEYQFFDLIRTLKYTLRTDFFNIYYPD